MTIDVHRPMITIHDILLWLKRATGIGYRRFGPLVGNEIDMNLVSKMREQADMLCRDLEQLERELKKREPS